MLLPCLLVDEKYGKKKCLKLCSHCGVEKMGYSGLGRMSAAVGSVAVKLGQ